jgi:biotin carboxyl carrier protein
MRLEIEIDGRLRKVELERAELKDGGQNGHWHGTIDGEAVAFEAHLLSPEVLSLIVGGASYRVVLEEDASERALLIAGRRVPYRVDDPRSLKSRRSHGAGADGPKTIKASMPGRVIRVLAQKGAQVEMHQGVVVIEAMKMQNELKSPKTGRVVEIRVSAGETVALGDVLAVIE